LYRKNPAGANIGLLALEWANYFFTIFIIVVRMIKLIIVTTASLGMIDRPFLAKGIGQYGRLQLDPLPTIHTCDILAHEAHRHPFIETLGLIYLMKFRYTDDFCHRAGSTWRLIFIYALMPWLHRYRIKENKADIGDGDKVLRGVAGTPLSLSQNLFYDGTKYVGEIPTLTEIIRTS